MAVDARPSPRPLYSVEMLGLQLAVIRRGMEACAAKRYRSSEAGELVEALLITTEALVWGEKHDGSLFDLFCERQSLPAFVAAFLACTTPTPVRVQLLQTLSILVANARRDTTTFYLFSGGHLNTLLTGEPDLRDEEVRAYFVTFLKSLALRLDSDTAPLFLQWRPVVDNTEADPFPLFSQAVRFAVHREQMVSTASRAALLSLLGIDHPEVRRRSLDAACRLLVPSLTKALRLSWVAAGAAVRRGDAGTLSRVCETEEDLLAFVSELLQLGVEPLAGDLVQGVLAELLPFLLRLAPPLAYPEHPTGPTADADAMDIPVASGGCDADDVTVETLTLDIDTGEPVTPADEPVRSLSGGSAHADVVRVGCQLLNQNASSSHGNSIQQTFVGSVMSNIVAGALKAPGGSPALQQKLSEVARMLNQRALGPVQEGEPEALPISQPDRAEELEETSAPAEPPALAVAVRTLAACTSFLGRQKAVAESLAMLLCAPTAESSLVAAVYSPGCEMEAATAVAGLTVGPKVAGERDAVEGAEAQGGTLSVPIPNPFSEAMFALLAGAEVSVEAAASAPHVAWARWEFDRWCPHLRDILFPPKQLVKALRPCAALPRHAQRTVAAVVRDLATGSSCSRTDRREVAAAATTSLREAAALLRSGATGGGWPAGRTGRVNLQDVVLCFVDEWGWHSSWQAPMDVPSACGVKCLLPSDASVASDPSRTAPPWRRAAQSVLTLRWLRAQISDIEANDSGPCSRGSKVQEQCPVDVDSTSEGPVITETIACAGPAGFGYTLLLHPTRLSVREPGEKIALDVPMWRVSVDAQGADPLQISLRVAPVGQGLAGTAKAGGKAVNPQNMQLSFSDAGLRSRALQHLDECRRREVQLRAAQVVSFADGALREASGLTDGILSI